MYTLITLAPFPFCDQITEVLIYCNYNYHEKISVTYACQC